ncbi:hypothetical protein [Streptomyces sp. NPDC050560]|uniref:hypothetical protein n=1 Tax=Streptomyces sp. NPDC050560 TaxID=3365630 RepID=UPI0037AEB377
MTERGEVAHMSWAMRIFRRRVRAAEELEGVAGAEARTEAVRVLLAAGADRHQGPRRGDR